MKSQPNGENRPRRPRRLAVALAAGVLLVAAGSYLGWRTLVRQAPTKQAAVVVRTAKVYQGTIEETIRLTGTTAAERYAGLLAPQLRGSRGGRGLAPSLASRTARSYSVSVSTASAASSSSAGTSSASGASGSGSSAASSGAATASTATGGGESSGGGGGSGSSGGGGLDSGGGGSRSGSLTRSVGGVSFSRVGGGGGGPGGGRGGGAVVAVGEGGFSRGGSDFTLILQDVVKPGSYVKKGDVVAEFDRQFMLTRLDDYRASMAMARAGMRILESDLEVDKKVHQQSIESAKADLEKAQIDLKTTPVQSAIMTERLKLIAEHAEARYKELLKEVSLKEIGHQADRKIAEIELKQAEVELKRAEANADRMLVRAPIDGVVVMESIFRSGEMARIQAGDQLAPGMMFMRIVDPSSMIVQARVNQVDIERLRIGQRARVHFDAYPGLELPAHVHAVAPMPLSGGFRASYVKEVPVVLKLDKMDPRVIPDLSVSVDVILDREESAVVAPMAAVFQDSPSSKPYVFLRGPSGWEKREVELGLSNHVMVAVRSGLRAGDVIALDRPSAEEK